MNVTNIFTASNGKSSGVNQGYGGITLDDLVTINFSIMKSAKDSSLWVGWPQREGKDKEGNRKYFAHVFFPESALSFKKELETLILEDYATKIDSQAEPTKTYAQKKDAEESSPTPPAPLPPKKKLWNTPT
jgi:hypothetical protein